MSDYQKMYRRELRKRVVLEARFQRIRRTLAAGLPEKLTLLAICLITGRQHPQNTPAL